MKLVVDVNVVLAVVLAEPERTWAIESTRGGAAVAPLSFPFELGNALTSLVKRRRLSTDGMHAAWKAAGAFEVSLRPIDIGAALHLAGANDIYAYDAYALQCAVENRAILVTLDDRLANVGRRIGLEVMER